MLNVTIDFIFSVTGSIAYSKLQLRIVWAKKRKGVVDSLCTQRVMLDDRRPHQRGKSHGNAVFKKREGAVRRPFRAERSWKRSACTQCWRAASQSTHKQHPRTGRSFKAGLTPRRIKTALRRAEGAAKSGSHTHRHWAGKVTEGLGRVQRGRSKGGKKRNPIICLFECCSGGEREA